MIRGLLPFFLIWLATIGGTLAQERVLTVAATTSIEDSGLFASILPKFKEHTGITVRVLSRSSALALVAGQRGHVDVMMVNDPGALDRFVDAGHGVKRHRVMFNDFVIVGPPPDPAGVRDSKDAAAALRAIASARARFVSRGDESGTHVAEQRVWNLAGINPKLRSGNWYLEVGLGMGATLEMASRTSAYCFTDRATWLALKDRIDLALIRDGDPRLFNQYEVVLVNPDKYGGANGGDGSTFIDWLVSDEGQAAIATYQVGGQQTFFPNAKPQN